MAQAKNLERTELKHNAILKLVTAKFTGVNSRPMLTHFYVTWQQSYGTLRCSGGHFGFCPLAANAKGYIQETECVA